MLERAEIHGKPAFYLVMQDLTAQIAQTTQDKAKAFQATANAEGDLKHTTDTRAAWRAGEFEAINKAVEIISAGWSSIPWRRTTSTGACGGSGGPWP